MHYLKLITNLPNHQNLLEETQREKIINGRVDFSMDFME